MNDGVNGVDVEGLSVRGKRWRGDEVSVVIEALDSWNGDGGVRLVTEEEKGCSWKLREVFTIGMIGLKFQG